jgi:8-oxo-dGTP diphosphatase
VRVAAGVLQRADGRILLAQRLAGTPYAGYWEFPGGKLEPGESAPEALARELDQEIGIEVVRSASWLRRVYTYPHATVELRFFRVLAWRGEPRGRDGQALSWEHASDVHVAPVLPANGAVFDALAQPPVYGISIAEDIGQGAFLGRAHAALEAGLKLIQIREKNFPVDALESLTRKLVALARPLDAKVLLNGSADNAQRWGCDGVHLTSDALRRTQARPAFSLCAASCHDSHELALAQDLELDFAVLGPVSETPSHPGVTTLGWERWEALAEHASIPLYALGGLRQSDLPIAQAHGAHGVALRSGEWTLTPD